MPEVKPLAIVLGGTNPHIPLIENLEGRGYHVILADYLEAPPARRVADEHVRICGRPRCSSSSSSTAATPA